MNTVKAIGLAWFAIMAAGTAGAWSHSPASQSFGTSGGSFTLTVSGTENYSWYAGSSESWISVSRVSATTFSVTVTENTDSDSRSGNVTINAFQGGSTASAQTWVNMQSCGITQDGTGGGGTSGSGESGDTDSKMTVDPLAITFGSAGGCSPVAVSGKGSWSVKTSLDWISADVVKGEGNGTVVLTALANTNIVARSGRVRIGGKTINVSQLAAPISCGITNVCAEQIVPWSGKVRVTYEIYGDMEAWARRTGHMLDVSITGMDLDTGTTYVPSELAGDFSPADGMHSLVWDLDAEGISFDATNFSVKVSYTAVPASYCIVDLSSGSTSDVYQVSYTNACPTKWTVADKTSKLWLRRINPGSYSYDMNLYYDDGIDCWSTYRAHIELTQPYYMAVFEMTQDQCQYIVDSSTVTGSVKPISTNYVSDDFNPRGSDKGTHWPESDEVDDDSVIGKLRSRTGLRFDLPTCAQWDYACGAGTTTTYFWGDEFEGYSSYAVRTDVSDQHWDRTYDVGTRLPNPWGLYDMVGNVWELCQDWWYGYDFSDPANRYYCPSNEVVGVNPKGPSDGADRTMRGGCSAYSIWNVIDGAESYGGHYSLQDKPNDPKGYRMCLPIPEMSMTTTLEASSSPVRVNTSDKVAMPQITCEFSGVDSYALLIDWPNSWEVRYTLDGSDPQDGMVYSGQVLFSCRGDRTVKAIAISPTGETSEVATLDIVAAPTPTISPADRSVISGKSLTVNISCSDTNAVIHYTTDGSEPTASSPVYKRFKISAKTTIKAIAVSEGLAWSETATAAYAFGQCADPTIAPADGTVFDRSNQPVTIAWDSSGGGILRYTTDGSEPTAESPVYVEPFTISGTTTVKAKVFSDTYFDSAVTSATLTRVWSIGGSLGDPDRTFSTDATTGWVRDQAVSHDGDESMRSGAIGDSSDGYVESTLSTVVSGKGTVKFWWKASCEEDEDYEWDHAEFRVDDETVARINGESDWLEVSHEIGSGEHTLSWVFLKDDYGSEGDDCVWLDAVSWEAAAAPAEPIPDLGESPTETQIAEALAGSEDAKLAANITDGKTYNAYREWAGAVKGSDGQPAGQQAVKDAPNAWVSFALGSDTILARAPTDADVTVEAFEPTDEDVQFAFTVSIADVSVGSGMSADQLDLLKEKLKQVLGIEGASSLDTNAFSSDNVDLTFGTPEDGKVKLTAGAKDTSQATFFMRVKMTP